MSGHRAASFALALATALVASPIHGAPMAEPVVRTSYGPVRGVTLAGDVKAFLGVRYGADTGGANRFLPPKAPKPWTDVQAADRMGPRCPQPPLPPSIIKFSKDPISEDCLVLNVWTPSLSGKRPVMVWLHGGGFSFGSANDDFYDGQGLAKRGDVVLVSINHRLNAFGYLELGKEAGPQYVGSSLTGQDDIIAALKWVQANAARFGGDPGNVTLFGQSGGGGKISALLGMPAAKGLFKKAIIESGSDPKSGEPAEAIEVRNKVLAALNLKPEEAGKLRDTPMADLIAASAKVGLLSYHPAVDGRRLPVHPFDPVASPVSADVPLMVGYTHDEATGVLYASPSWPKTTDALVEAQAKAILGPKAPDALAAYRARAPQDKPMYTLAALLTDQSFTGKAITLAQRKADQGKAPVYVFRTDWRTPVMDGLLRSPHGIEIPFVFDTVAKAPDFVGPASPSTARMTELFIATFSAFAHTSNPSVKGYPAWPAYTRAERKTFIYDDTPKVVSDPDPALRKVWAPER
jgi:para-nitrobenzyl esterase